MNHSVLGSLLGVEKPARWVRAGAQRRIDGMARQHGVGQQENPDGLRCVQHIGAQCGFQQMDGAWPHQHGCCRHIRLQLLQVAHLRGPVPVHQQGARHMGQCQLGQQRCWVAVVRVSKPLS